MCISLSPPQHLQPSSFHPPHPPPPPHSHTHTNYSYAAMAITAHVCRVAGSDDVVVVEEELDIGVIVMSDAEQLQVVVRVLQGVLVPLAV